MIHVSFLVIDRSLNLPCFIDYTPPKAADGNGELLQLHTGSQTRARAVNAAHVNVNVNVKNIEARLADSYLSILFRASD